MQRREPQKPKFSLYVSDFLRVMENAQKDYAWNSENVVKMDQLTQDYLHKLELDDLDYKERAKVATLLARCRRQRRDSKDTTQILEPLVLFLDTDKGRNLMNLMREVLGKTRRVEEFMEHRTYVPRVLEEDEAWTKS